MKLSRFYQDSPLYVGETLELSAQNHRHAIQVLRLKKDEPVIFFNGKGGEYLARLNLVDKRHSNALIESYDPVDRESPIKISLAMALIKPDKMDFAIQKAVELGAHAIQPLYTKRSVVKIKLNRLEKKMQHWQGIIIAACEQSGRTAIPALLPPQTLETHLSNSKTAGYTGLALLPGNHPKLSDLETPELENGITLYIGPEGGFTDEEELLMKQHDLNAINMGSRILRAETAAIAGITACQMLWGDI